MHKDLYHVRVFALVGRPKQRGDAIGGHRMHVSASSEAIGDIVGGSRFEVGFGVPALTIWRIDTFFVQRRAAIEAQGDASENDYRNDGDDYEMS